MKWTEMGAPANPRLAFTGLLAVLWLAVVFIFWPAHTFNFLFFDDNINIYINPNLGGFDKTTTIWMLTDIHYMRRYIPAGWLGFGVLYELFGLNPHGYHAANIVMHGVNAVLLMAICREVLRRFHPDRADDCWALCMVALASAWWAWHPMRVETVAWASGWMYIQSVFFLLVSFYLYIKRPQSVMCGRIKMLASIVCYIISLATYPLALGYPAVLLFWEIARLQRENGSYIWSGEGRRMFFSPFSTVLAGFGPAALIFGGITLYANYNADSFWHTTASYAAPLNVAEKIGRAVYVWGYYLWKPWWPLHPMLVQDGLDRAAWHEKHFLLCVLTLVAALWLFFIRKSSLRLGFWAAGAAYLVLLVPMLGLTQPVYFTADRYNYLCSLPLVIALAVWLAAYKNHLLRWVLGLTLVLIVFCQIGFSRKQLPAWKNSNVFFSTALGEFPRPSKEKAHLCCVFAGMLGVQGHFGQAETVRMQGFKEFRNVSEFKTQDSEINASARAAAQIAREFGMKTPLPELARSHFWIATQKMQRSEWCEASDHLHAALDEAPDFYLAWLDLGQVLIMQGRLEDAVACYMRAIVAPGAQLANEKQRRFLFMLELVARTSGNPRLAGIALKRERELETGQSH